MATVNRYTRLTPSEYNPLSLEEQLMVPLFKQKQQEGILDAKDEVEAELANLQRLQQDDPFVTEKTNQYRNQLDAISQNISDEGVNRETSRNFRKLYSDYKFDISNSGDLGRAQNNYLTAKEREKEARANFLKQGHTQDKINELIEKGYNAFTGTVGEDGQRNEFGNFDGPGYYSPEQEAIQLYSKAASNGFSVGKAGSDIQFMEGPGGSIIAQVNYDTVSKEQRNNAEQIAEGYNALMSSYSFGDRKAFADLYGYDKQKLTDVFSSLGGVFKSKITKDFEDHKTNLTVVSRGSSGGSATRSPGGSTWFSQPIYGKVGAASENALNNRLSRNIDNASREFYTRGIEGPITDSRIDPNISEKDRLSIAQAYGEVPGSFQKNKENGYADTIDGDVLNQIITSDGFGVQDGIIGTKDGKMIVEPLSNNKAVAIHGEWNGQKYALTVADPNLVNMVNKSYTDPTVFKKASDSRKQMIKMSQDFKSVNSFLNDGNWSDYDIAKAYENSVRDSSNYIQTAHYTNNLDNSYYNEKDILFGKKDNLAALTTRKVRVTTKDGSELINASGEEAIDFLTKRLTGLDSDFSDLKLEDKNKVIEKLKNSGDLGYTPGDYEMPNSLNFSLTDRDGNALYLQVENNNELSGRNDRYPGIDDLAEVQRYMIEGKHFVKKDKSITKRDGLKVDYDQFFIQVPYLNENNQLEIIPYVIYADKSANINTYQQLMPFLNPETMQPADENNAILGVETRNDVYDRVLKNMNTVYDNSVEQKTTNTEYGKRIDNLE